MTDNNNLHVHVCVDLEVWSKQKLMETYRSYTYL